MNPSCSPAGSAASRRAFLRQVGGAAALGGLALASHRSAAGAATAGPDLSGTAVGCNIYVWAQEARREQRALDVGAVMSTLRDCGYDYLEGNLNLLQPEENIRFAEQSRARGLKPVSLYVGARLHEPAAADERIGAILAAAKVCRREGFRILVCNAEPVKGRDKTDDELATQAAAYARLGAGLSALGMRLAVHDHLPGLANRARELRSNFGRTPAADVGFCYDVHWLWRGGMPPTEALPAFGSRLVTWHIRQSRDDVWWEELDSGDIDYAWIARYAAEHRLPRYFTVELAMEPKTRTTRSLVENHRRSRDFIRRVFGA